MPQAYIALGSNVGDKKGNIALALSLLTKSSSVQIQKRSSLYITEPAGYEDQEDFLNMVIKIYTELSPRELFSLCKSIEKEMGRVTEIRWGPRVIDLDILLYEDNIIKEEDLVIPHPRMHERAFVLIPLAEIEPYLVHPVLGKDIKNLIKELKTFGRVEKI